MGNLYSAHSGPHTPSVGRADDTLRKHLPRLRRNIHRRIHHPRLRHRGLERIGIYKSRAHRLHVPRRCELRTNLQSRSRRLQSPAHQRRAARLHRRDSGNAAAVRHHDRLPRPDVLVGRRNHRPPVPDSKYDNIHRLHSHQL